MLEAIDIILEDDTDFWDLYQQDVLGREASSQERADVKSALTDSVCVTLSKLLYRSLADAFSRKAVSLSELFALLSIFDADMSGHILSPGDAGTPGDAVLPVEYHALRNAFFAALDEALELPEGTLQDAYGSYGGQEAAMPGGLTCLDRAKNAFLARMYSASLSPGDAAAS